MQSVAGRIWSCIFTVCVLLPGMLSAQGNVGIGVPSPQYLLDIAGEGERTLNILNSSGPGELTSAVFLENNVSSTGNHYGLRGYLTGSGEGNVYGAHIQISNTGNGHHYGAYHSLSGPGVGAQTGVRNTIFNSGDGTHYGVYNHLDGVGNGAQYGMYNTMSNSGSGIHYGMRNVMTSNGNANRYGVNNSIGGTGAGDIYGIYTAITNSGDGYHYGIRNALSQDGDGSQFGSHNTLSGTGTGNKYAVYGLITAGTNGTAYAGYFSGDVTVTGTFHNPSDRTLKKAITPARSGVSSLEKLKSLEIYTYEYDRGTYPFLSLPGGLQTGLIAQELQDVFPELVKLQVHPAYEPIDDKDPVAAHEKLSYLGVNYVGMIPHLIRGIQEQESHIEALEKHITEQEKSTQAMLEMLEDLVIEIAILKAKH